MPYHQILKQSFIFILFCVIAVGCGGGGKDNPVAGLPRCNAAFDSSPKANATTTTGFIVYQNCTKGLSITDIATGTTTVLFDEIEEGPRSASDPAPSPDGTKIVFMMTDESKCSGASSIQVFNRDTGTTTSITDLTVNCLEKAEDKTPYFLNNGSIVFHRFASDLNNIYQTTLTGTTTLLVAHATRPIPSRDGSVLYFLQDDTESISGVYAMTIGTTTITKVSTSTSTPEENFAVAPNGTIVVVRESELSKIPFIAVIKANGSYGEIVLQGNPDQDSYGGAISWNTTNDKIVVEVSNQIEGSSMVLIKMAGGIAVDSEVIATFANDGGVAFMP